MKKTSLIVFCLTCVLTLQAQPEKDSFWTVRYPTTTDSDKWEAICEPFERNWVPLGLDTFIAQRTVMQICDFIGESRESKIADGEPFFEIRIGIHTGPVVAGILGVKKFSYDIWGDTVNTASRMESSGEAGQVNIREATYERVKNEPEFNFTSRGNMEAKGKGQLEMYCVDIGNRT